MMIKLYLLMWVQLLFLKTETLYLVEILASLKGDHVVCADASDRLVCWVQSCIEC